VTRFAVRSSSRLGGRAAGPWWAWLLVAAAVGWNLASLRALLVGVPYLNDSSVHEQMVRFATAQWRAGHLPLTSWFPFLGEGSPQFLHYQSLPAMVTGAAGLVIGPDVAFRWSLYLLLGTWPISVYLAARAFGSERPAAAASAAMAPFLVSIPGVGYEQHAYVWTGFGVWTQLWAMWTLPLAWGFSWRAIREGRGYLRAVLFTALTGALHFETGYLALAVLIVWPVVAGRPCLMRARRAALILIGSLLATAWATVPLLQQRSWAAVNQPLQGTGLVNGYGAHQVLGWLISGQLLDHGRLPVITILAAVGFGLAWLGWSSDVDGRGLLIALAICLLLAFGRTTFGSLVDVIPGSPDLFFRRFMMGIQLVALMFAGRGGWWLAARCVRVIQARVAWWRPSVSAAVALAAGVAVLAPAWLQLGSYDLQDSAAIHAQQHADVTQGRQLDRLIAVIRRDGGGRTSAGMPSNWGQTFTVGQVPVFKYLESRDVDEVGYTLRTASLMTDPEYYLDDKNPSDYRLFAIRYLILPTGRTPRVHARLMMRSGAFTLWTVSHDGYIQAGRIAGRIAADRDDVGPHAIPLLRSDLPAAGDYLSVRYGSRSGGSGRLPLTPGRRATGTVLSGHASLTQGDASATVRLRSPGVAVLSASYDPGWTAEVNGHRQPVRMIAPALVAVDVPAGTDRITFHYHGDRDYPQLLALAGASLVAVAYGPLAWRRGRRGGAPA
jgi:hypothetical protein